MPSDVVPLCELEGNAEAAEEDRDVRAGMRERPDVVASMPHGLMLRDGGKLLERRRDPPERLVCLTRPQPSPTCRPPHACLTALTGSAAGSPRPVNNSDQFRRRVPSADRRPGSPRLHRRRFARLAGRHVCPFSGLSHPTVDG